MSEYPFLLTADTLPIGFTSDGIEAVTHSLWTTPAGSSVIRQIIIQNPTENPVFYIKIGTTSGIAATSSNHQIYPGTIQTFSVNEYNNYFSALSASGTATLTVTPGAGE